MNLSRRQAVLSGLPDEVLAEQRFDAAQSAALFVGVRLFKQSQFTEVPCAVDDAVDLAHLFASLGLVKPARTLLCIAGEPRKKDSQTRLEELTAEGATCSTASITDIYCAIDRQSKKCGEQGMFLVGIASHGLSHEGTDLILAHDTVYEMPVRTSVQVTEIFNAIMRSKAPRRMVLLDACREHLEGGVRSTAEVATGQAMSDSFAKAIGNATGQVVLSGTVSGGFCYDDPERENGVFSAAVIDGLCGEAQGDERNLITAETLASYVDARVQTWVRNKTSDHVSRGIGKNFDGMCASMPLAMAAAAAAPAPTESAEDAYRKEVTELLANDGEISVIERQTLEEERERLGIDKSRAEAIEREMMVSCGERKGRIDRYRETVKLAIEAYGHPFNDARRAELKARQARLGLTDEEIAGIEEAVAAQCADTAGTADAEVDTDAGIEADIAPRPEAQAEADPLRRFIETQILSERALPPREVELAECAMIEGVAKGSLAERLGLGEGDLLLSINGESASRFGTSLHRRGVEPEKLLLRSAKKGFLEIETTGVEPGIGIAPTPEAILASDDLMKDDGSLRRLWQLGEWAKLAWICLSRSDVEDWDIAAVEAVLRDRPGDTFLPLRESGHFMGLDATALYLGACLMEAGDPRGMEFISSFIELGMDSYTVDHHVVAQYYVCLSGEDEYGTETLLAALSELYERVPYTNIASKITRLGGQVPQRPNGLIARPFPKLYKLRVLDGRAKVSLRDALGALDPHQLHMVVLMGPYRSNGPYEWTMYDYANVARHMDQFVPSLHVLTSSDGKGENEAFFEAWLGQERAVRAAGLPLIVLNDKGDRIVTAVGSTGVPHILLLDADGIVRFDSMVDEFGGEIWTGLHRLMSARSDC